ncbi:LysR family transcriptional regulator [Methylotenera sp. N17]|uniref:LysR family transcriptional regulator n=1 Tax=Methylotenera sp. N17 TaxID=1502761 RepID=UPI000648107B|nr:LysR family transcriptional regulator [Methylotenera sp. N17]
METLSSIESFVRSAELGSFSAAARRLSLTPGGVSKNVAKLEADLGVRLFHRSTRSLTLTEAGEQFLAQVASGLDAIQSAIASTSTVAGQPAGTLKVGMAMAFGRDHILPLLGQFLERYPAIKPDWRFDNRQVDLIGEGFDAAIGGGIDIAPGVVVRELAKIHLILVASPQYLARKFIPKSPTDLQQLDALIRYSQTTNRTTPWHLKSTSGEQVSIELPPRITLNDPEMLCNSAIAGLGIAHVPMPHALRHLENGALVRVLPEWYTEAGAICLYFAAKKLMPAKTRVFVDFIVEMFRSQQLAEKWSAIRTQPSL